MQKYVFKQELLTSSYSNTYLSLHGMHRQWHANNLIGRLFVRKWAKLEQATFTNFTVDFNFLNLFQDN